MVQVNQLNISRGLLFNMPQPSSRSSPLSFFYDSAPLCLELSFLRTDIRVNQGSPGIWAKLGIHRKIAQELTQKYFGGGGGGGAKHLGRLTVDTLNLLINSEMVVLRRLAPMSEKTHVFKKAA